MLLGAEQVGFSLRPFDGVEDLVGIIVPGERDGGRVRVGRCADAVTGRG
jgi:hypothetical protein